MILNLLNPNDFLIYFIAKPFLILSIISLIVFFTTKKKDLLLANNYLFCFCILLIATLELIKILVSFYLGWFEEMLPLKIKIYKRYFYLFTFIVFVFHLIPLLGLKKKIRQKKGFQIIIFSTIVGMVLFRINRVFFDTRIPGYHTVFYEDSSLLINIIIVSVGIIINLLFVKFKLLPELK